MALEPLTPGPGAADDAELRDLGRRFWATLPLTAAGTAAPAMAGP
ncbi:hypothetical protein SAMN05216552_101876 [Pseudoduganella namucuonensis]|uniref:Uncharacterized protein n=2 Tax=Pseudoduganella namucuonensis TaxID=1035707 RepID=A0A1I7KP43_9BURK|nr:hypothetical protein SAMN05216552_101876 [Pseudoduganella namucuonensis]